MDALTASAVIQRQDSYAAPPNYIGPPGRCQRIDECRLLILDRNHAGAHALGVLTARIPHPWTIVHRQPPINHPSSLGSNSPDFMRISRKFGAR